jgi:glycosyltransferase involved in cell wall biosynthesis
MVDVYAYKWFHFAHYVTRLCRLWGIPYIPILHSYLLKEYIEQNSKPLRDILIGSKTVVCPSDFFKNLLVKLSLPVRVIPNPVHTSLLPFNPITEIKSPRLIWVRNLHPKYNPEMAIMVLSQLHKQYPGASLTMVGPSTPAYLTHLKNQCQQLDLQQHITFAGKLSTAEWVSLSRSHNLFINTSTIDNAPLSLIEAASLGLPIVSTNVGGIPILFEHGREALLSPNGDSTSMTKNILSLIQSPDVLQQMVNAAKAKAQTCDIDEVTRQWITLIEPKK